MMADLWKESIQIHFKVPYIKNKFITNSGEKFEEK